MGLTEKRAIRAFQDTRFPELEAQINDIAGCSIEFEVKWEQLAEPDYAGTYDETLPKIYFNPVINAFKAITVDDMGKEALRATLKKIVIKNENDIYSAHRAYQYENGTLTIDHHPVVNADDVSDRTRELEKLLLSRM